MITTTTYGIILFLTGYLVNDIYQFYKIAFPTENNET